ncbi:MAG: hypothetical protein KGQ83_11640 [Planctomycetes bacterium]|nr:hypothetical protein [Planctomycetota bacterium]
MELKEFVKKVIADAVEAVDESSATASRNITLAYRPNRRTIEFDVAVSAEETESTDGKAGVKVLSFMEAGANVGSEIKNATVSRITFGVDVSTITKGENAALQAMYEANRRNRHINDAR